MEEKIDQSSSSQREARPPLNLSGAHEIVGNWPAWKKDMADQILRPSPPPSEQSQVPKPPEASP